MYIHLKSKSALSAHVLSLMEFLATCVYITQQRRYNTAARRRELQLYCTVLYNTYPSVRGNGEGQQLSEGQGQGPQPASHRPVSPSEVNILLHQEAPRPCNSTQPRSAPYSVLARAAHAMANFRRFRPDDLNKLSKCNLDPFTETYELGFYLQYYAKWPSLFQVAEDQHGNIIGYSERLLPFPST